MNEDLRLIKSTSYPGFYGEEYFKKIRDAVASGSPSQALFWDAILKVKCMIIFEECFVKKADDRKIRHLKKVLAALRSINKHIFS